MLLKLVQVLVKQNVQLIYAVQGYIKLASQGRYKEALELIKHENPFPAVCGRICPRKCESACTRGDIDEPVAIDEIKKFIAEQDLNIENRYVPKLRHEYGNKIASYWCRSFRTILCFLFSY